MISQFSLNDYSSLLRVYCHSVLRFPFNLCRYLSDVELLPIIGKIHPSEQYYAKQQADYIISQVLNLTWVPDNNCTLIVDKAVNSFLQCNLNMQMTFYSIDWYWPNMDYIYKCFSSRYLMCLLCHSVATYLRICDQLTGYIKSNISWQAWQDQLFTKYPHFIKA